MLFIYLFIYLVIGPAKTKKKIKIRIRYFELPTTQPVNTAICKYVQRRNNWWEYTRWRGNIWPKVATIYCTEGKIMTETVIIYSFGRTLWKVFRDTWRALDHHASNFNTGVLLWSYSSTNIDIVSRWIVMTILFIFELSLLIYWQAIDLPQRWTLQVLQRHRSRPDQCWLEWRTK